MSTPRPPRWVFVGTVFVAHTATRLFTARVGIPFRLESWSTMAGVIAGAPFASALGAMLSRLVLTLVASEGSQWAAGLGVLLTTGLAALFTARGWLDIQRPSRLVASGVIMGIATTVFVLAFHMIGVEALPASADTLPFRRALGVALGVDGHALMIERLFLEVIDKTIAVIVATSVVTLLEDRFPWARRQVVGASA